MASRSDAYTVIDVEQCPACKLKGKDTSRDNLVVYKDGHKHCYACGYHEHTDAVVTYKKKQQDAAANDPKVVRLPTDIVQLKEAPPVAKAWIDQYNINEAAVLRQHIMWSDGRQRLIFPYMINGELIAWQGRWFGKGDAPKWYTDGPVDACIYVLGPTQEERVVLVEDIVSAMKLSSHIAASPIFGSVISPSRLKALRSVTKELIIWLDPDKRKESMKYQRIAQLFGFKCHVVLSDKDPKEHTVDEIKQFLELP